MPSVLAMRVKYLTQEINGNLLMEFEHMPDTLLSIHDYHRSTLI